MFRSSISIDRGLPCVTVRSAPAIVFSRPAQRSLTLWPARSPSRPCDPLHRRLQRLRYLPRCFDCYRAERTSSRSRDRIRARDTVRRRVTIAALSVAAWDPSFHHGPRFPEPPCNPGRSDFPIPVLTLAFPARPFRDQSGLSARPHTPQPMSVYRAARP